ncbi:MAG: hypothetical protein ACFE8E_04180 [Candidatus Hodarchaeota archaeon]
MNENNKNKIEEKETSEKKEKKSKRRKPAKKTQSQMMQEALGLTPDDIQDIEEKLFIARFLDYFAEETLDFIYKDRNLEQYVKRLTDKSDTLEEGNEEDKLLKINYNEKKILETIYKLKIRAEEIALSKGVKSSVDKRLRNLNLIVTLPLLAAITVLMFFPNVDLLFILPILCVFCIIPQLVRSSVYKKWLRFKDENKNEVYTDNREDIMILKSFVNEILNNIRAKLLELKVPLQLIKFGLYSRDYENLRLINQRSFRGVSQFYFAFEYPEGMEPYPIPETLQQYDKSLFPEKKVEKNFIVLTEMKGKDGIIESFIPTLKDTLAEKINQMLNDSEFSEAPQPFNDIIPNYSKEMGIYCLCGELASIRSVQITNWKNQFKFYLFEGKECNCGENFYALSLMYEDVEIPEELKDIFLS